jgi:hypothetical protein
LPVMIFGPLSRTGAAVAAGVGTSVGVGGSVGDCVAVACGVGDGDEVACGARDGVELAIFSAVGLDWAILDVGVALPIEKLQASMARLMAPSISRRGNERFFIRTP